MNRFAKDMLMARYGRGEEDGRNPYGSRGGYVTSRRPRRDRGMYYPHGGYSHHEPMREDMEHRDYPREMMGRDYDDMPRRDYERYDMRRMDYADEDDYGYYGDHGDYARSMGRGSRRGMRGGRRDYGEEVQYGKMTKDDMEDWKETLMNADGSKGEHFKKDHIEQVAKQMGINMEHMGGADVFAMTVNMMYADYCGVAKKFGVDRPEYYIELAKAFLEDKDFKGKGEEKLWLYYKCIAEQED